MDVDEQVYIGESSPRPWRCFSVQCVADTALLVFSTPVEVFP